MLAPSRRRPLARLGLHRWSDRTAQVGKESPQRLQGVERRTAATLNVLHLSAPLRLSVQSGLQPEAGDKGRHLP